MRASEKRCISPTGTLILVRNARMLECVNKHAPRTSVFTQSERSFEASGAGARSGIPRWSGNCPSVLPAVALAKEGPESGLRLASGVLSPTLPHETHEKHETMLRVLTTETQRGCSCSLNLCVSVPSVVKNTQPRHHSCGSRYSDAKNGPKNSPCQSWLRHVSLHDR